LVEILNLGIKRGLFYRQHISLMHDFYLARRRVEYTSKHWILHFRKQLNNLYSALPSAEVVISLGVKKKT